ncbi:MAG: hypothetical protein J0L56_14990 [Chitinophagales bacterium]|nr:hypothetical protein [Chitinophagales bacterium]
MKYMLTILILTLTLSAYAQTEEVVTNQTIIQLQKAGLGKEVIKTKIQASNCNFDLSTEGLIALKKASIPDDVISVMLAKTSTPATKAQSIPNTENPGITIPSNTGIYFLDSVSNKFIELEPSLLTNQKSGGFGETLKRSVSTLFNAKQRASLSGKEANTKLYTHKPVFLFVFDTTTSGFSNSSSVWSNVQSPNEFFLVTLTVSKNSREIVVGKQNNVKSDMGISDEVKIAMTSKKIRRGVYEVAIAEPMQRGEYCFMFAASSMYGGQSHKVYDFSVR